MTPHQHIQNLEKRQETITRIDNICYLMKQTYKQIEVVDTYINPYETPFGISKYKAKAKERLYAILGKLEKSYARQVKELTKMH